jgi:hypothetical protein
MDAMQENIPRQSKSKILNLLKIVTRGYDIDPSVGDTMRYQNPKRTKADEIKRSGQRNP